MKMKLKIKKYVSLPIIILLGVVGCTSSDINNNIPVNSNELVDTNVTYKNETVKVKVDNQPSHSLDTKIEEHNENNSNDNTVRIIVDEKKEISEDVKVITPPPANDDEVVSFVKLSYDEEDLEYQPEPKYYGDSEFERAVRAAEEKRGIKPASSNRYERPTKKRKFVAMNEETSAPARKTKPAKKFDIKDVEAPKSITFLSAIIYHSNAKADISQNDMRALKSVANFVNRNNATVRVVGNSSSRSKNMKEIQNKLKNFDLSILRAEKVRDALIKYGVPSDKILISGVADTEKVVEENMPINEAINRRTEIYINY